VDLRLVHRPEAFLPRARRRILFGSRAPFHRDVDGDWHQTAGFLRRICSSAVGPQRGPAGRRYFGDCGATLRRFVAGRGLGCEASFVVPGSAAIAGWIHCPRSTRTTRKLLGDLEVAPSSQGLFCMFRLFRGRIFLVVLADDRSLLTRQSLEPEREQILQRPVVVELHPACPSAWLRRRIQHRRDVTAAFDEKNFRGRLELITCIWKIRM
jgi:hypothetical protein